MSSALKIYGIPKTTLYDKVHNRYAGNRIGAKTVLTEAEEKWIADWAIHMSTIGYGRTRKELVNLVQNVLNEDGRINPFKNNRPGRDWLRGFFKRHPDLTVHTSMQLGKEQAIVNNEKITNWFAGLQRYVADELGDAELLLDPTRIYNADESGFSLCVNTKDTA